MFKFIKTEILINATPEKVWTVLTDFEKYSSWNSFVISIKGEVKEGSRIEILLQPPDSGKMKFKPQVLVFQKNKELRWLGHLLFKGIFDGEHKFELIDNNNGTTTLIQSEKFNGILVGLFGKMIDNNTLKGFKKMNEELKALLESKN